MSRYDGLIIPRSYSEYINKTDAATLLQALQLSGVMDAEPTSGSNKPVKSGGVYSKLVNGGEWQSIGYTLGTEFTYKIIGKTVFLHIGTGAVSFPASGADMVLTANSEIVYLPQNIRPSRLTQFTLYDNVYDTLFHARLYQTGEIRAWGNQFKNPQDVNSWQADFCYRID